MTGPMEAIRRKCEQLDVPLVGVAPVDRWDEEPFRAWVPPDPMMKENMCMRCARSCPAQALVEKEYPQGITLKDRCTDHNLRLAERYISPCGICIKVCPVGADRAAFGRKDAGLYEGRKGHEAHYRAWEHVRAYGGKRT